MKFIVVVPSIPVRKEATHKSELLNQLLFGESIKILKTQNSWIFVEGLHDHYQGWVENKSWFLEKSEHLGSNLIVNCFVARVIFKENVLQIPFGSLVNSPRVQLISGSVTDKMNINNALECIDKELINSAYLWGGRTGFGMDCSGLTQLFYRLIGISLPRDASQQCLLGDDLFLSQVSSGDLLFYRNENQMISHVGIAFDEKTILHASGTVRRDRYDETGIYNLETSQYTHQFAFAKNFTRLL